jgi:hypothetical protein
MSGIPAERFLISAQAPKDREGFFNFLREQKVEYLVYFNKSDSTPARHFPEAGQVQAERFTLVGHSKSGFLPLDIRLYRVH